MPDPSHPDDPKPIGKPASLFDTDEVRPIQVPPPDIPSPAGAADGYELEGDPFPDVDEPPMPVPIPIPPPPVERPRVKMRPKAPVERPPLDESGSTEFVTEVSGVDPVWTRMGEWGPDLYRVLGVGLGTLVLVYLFGFGTFGLLLFLAGGAATVLLSYPLLVTLERPVRITPEQAVADFFAAASHHFPHYRRMWLLLSDVGRESAGFSSFEEFRDSWKARVEGWRRDAGAGQYAPLKFEVEAFRADKSTGKETSRADYTVHVRLRDREDVGPIESFHVSHGLVKGPDRMWYLNRGVLQAGSK